MYKYGLSSELLKLTQTILYTIISRQRIPALFNLGVIKPIIKDINISHSCLNNLRPITVSDPLATIFEKILLLDINRYHVDNAKQFGFKKNSSCAHAVAALRETILLKRCLKRKTYVCYRCVESL